MDWRANISFSSARQAATVDNCLSLLIMRTIVSSDGITCKARWNPPRNSAVVRRPGAVGHWFESTTAYQ